MNRKHELGALSKKKRVSLIYLFGSQAQKGLALLNGISVEADDYLEGLKVINRGSMGP